MMLDQDASHSQDELQIEGLASSPVGGNLYDICEHNALFSDPLPNSGEVSSCSGCCYDESSYTNDLSSFSLPTFPPSYPNPAAANTTTPTSEAAVSSAGTFSALLDAAHQDPAASAFLPCAALHDQFDLHIPLPDVNAGSCYAGGYPAPALPSIFDEAGRCQLSPMQPAYVRVDAGGSFLDQYGGGMNGLTGAFCIDARTIFSGGLMPDPCMHAQDLESQGESSALYGSDSVFGSGELPVLNEGQQQMVKGGGGLPSDISTLEESSFKVGRLSVEERKEKIHRYLKKKNERNFSKKIKYACRKTLADSRPRVRGRFAKNDEFGEAPRRSCSHHEDEEEEEGGVKEEEQMLDSSDIYTHISGVNSFKCSFPIQSWNM